MIQRLGSRARLALLGLVARLVTGRGIPPGEREAIGGRIRLMGFRKTARGFLLTHAGDGAGRADAGPGVGAGAARPDLRILAPALDGLFTLAVSADDLAVGHEVVATGTYEPHIAAFYRRFLRPGMRVVDVGANIGFHALHAAAIVGPTGRVLAFEPDPENAALIRLSLSIRDPRPPVEVIEAALSDADGALILSDLGNPGNSGARFTGDDRARLEPLVHGPAPAFRSVRAVRFDAHFGADPIDLVKIDVEGFEPRALAGMAGSIERFRPAVLSEFAPENLRLFGGLDPAAYLAWFLDRGYACAVLEEPGGEETAATPRDVMARFTGRRHHVDLLFAPAHPGDRAR